MSRDAPAGYLRPLLKNVLSLTELFAFIASSTARTPRPILPSRPSTRSTLPLHKMLLPSLLLQARRSPQKARKSLLRVRRNLQRVRRNLQRARRSLQRVRRSLLKAKRSLILLQRSLLKAKRSLQKARRSLQKARRKPHEHPCLLAPQMSLPSKRAEHQRLPSEKQNRKNRTFESELVRDQKLIKFLYNLSLAASIKAHTFVN